MNTHLVLLRSHINPVTSTLSKRHAKRKSTSFRITVMEDPWKIRWASVTFPACLLQLIVNISHYARCILVRALCHHSPEAWQVTMSWRRGSWLIPGIVHTTSGVTFLLPRRPSPGSPRLSFCVHLWESQLAGAGGKGKPLQQSATCAALVMRERIMSARIDQSGCKKESVPLQAVR